MKLNKYLLINLFIASVWFINGLYCKILNLVPRHQEIISTILGKEYTSFLVNVIGVSEILMAIWVLSKFKSKISAIVQIAIILIMNIIEFILVPKLLLWGKFNIIFAFLFTLVIYYNEFIIKNTKLKK